MDPENPEWPLGILAPHSYRLKPGSTYCDTCPAPMLFLHSSLLGHGTDTDTERTRNGKACSFPCIRSVSEETAMKNMSNQPSLAGPQLIYTENDEDFGLKSN